MIFQIEPNQNIKIFIFLIIIRNIYKSFFTNNDFITLNKFYLIKKNIIGFIRIKCFKISNVNFL